MSRHLARHRGASWLVLVVVCLLAAAPRSRAGGGPHNVLLVVNARSWASLTVANHYAKLRDLPATHVVYLDWPLSVTDPTPIDAFRKSILGPVLEAIERRNLVGQIDYVTYAPDFPYQVYGGSDFAGQKFQQGFQPYGSLSSFTYLYAAVMAKRASPLEAEANFYFRRPTNGAIPDSHAFRYLYGWTPKGERQDAEGAHFFISTLLAMTSGRGNSVPEALAALQAAREADATRPPGTIYYLENADIRSQVRKPTFPAAVAELTKLGVHAEIVQGIMPTHKPDVQGAMLGTQLFDWQKSGSTILPGAICETLTSTSGFLKVGGNQTPCTDFIRFGAAGTCGCVVEPLALPQKFPSPMVHVHYARGSSLGEAFYQSVQAPYQLLIVGDPLCQPWAERPVVEPGDLPAESELKGEITFTPVVKPAEGRTIRAVEVLLDGRVAVRGEPGKPLVLDTKDAADGAHQLAIVATDDSPVETQGRYSRAVTVNNHGHSISLKLVGDGPTVFGRPIRLAINASAGSAVHVFHETRRIGGLPITAGNIDIDSRILGYGPVRLRAMATEGVRAESLAVSETLELVIEPAPLLPAQKAPAGRLHAGLEFQLAGGRKLAIEDTAPLDWLEKAGASGGAKYTLGGFVEVPADDTYQLQFTHGGPLTVEVDGVKMYAGNVPESSAFTWHYLPVALTRGWHRVEIQGETTAKPRLELNFGGPGAWPAGARQFKHGG
ncbi:MAG: hypothetical protein AB7O68_00985 [Pirellulales bacterium]